MYARLIQINVAFKCFTVQLFNKNVLFFNAQKVCCKSYFFLPASLFLKNQYRWINFIRIQVRYGTALIYDLTSNSFDKKAVVDTWGVSRISFFNEMSFQLVIIWKKVNDSPLKNYDHKVSSNFVFWSS